MRHRTVVLVGLGVALCAGSGCGRAARPRAASSPAATAGPTAPAGADDLELGHDARGLREDEEALVRWMVGRAVADPVARVELIRQLTGCLVHTPPGERAGVWRFFLCYGGGAGPAAPAVIVATGPDADDGAPVTATVRIRRGLLAEWELTRPDGLRVDLPEADAFAPQRVAQWHVSARGRSE
jgi:hypothetical protein